MQVKKYLIFQFISLLGIATPLFADKLAIQDITEKFDIPRKRVNCMYQDSKGFMWFGMINGLCKFDQYSYTFYDSRKNSLKSFPESDIRAIGEIKPGLLLVGTYDKGLWAYDSGLERTLTIVGDTAIDFSKLNVKCLYIQKSGLIWVGTYKGLYRLKLIGKESDKIEVTVIRDHKFDGLFSHDFRHLQETDPGNMWFVTMNDIGCYNVKANDLKVKSVYLGSISTFAFLDSRRMLVGFYGNGLRVFDTETFELKPFPIKGVTERTLVRYIYKDKKSNIWLSLTNEGVILLETGDKPGNVFKERYLKYPEINSHGIYQVNETRDGTLWLCGDDGINAITVNPDHFKSFLCPISAQSPTQNAGVRSLLGSANKDFIWAGTIGGGLKQFNIKTGKFTDVPLVIQGKKIGTTIQAIMQDRNGNIWLGTEGDGIIKFNPNKNKSIITNYRRYPNPIPAQSVLNDYIMCLFEDKEGNIWIGTWYGLSLIEKGELNKADQSQIILKNFLNNPKDSLSISNNIVMSLQEDYAGNIWVGTQGGLNKIVKTPQGYKFQRRFKIRNAEYLSGKSILSIFCRKNGDIWFSSQKGGISHFDKKRGLVEELNYENAFFNNIINSINEDKAGNLWLGSNHGLCRLNPVSRSFDIFTKEDGLISNDFLFSSTCKIDNYLCFGLNTGLILFSPQDIVLPSIKPNLVFTDFRLFNKTVDSNKDDSPLQHHISYQKSVILKHNQNFITIAFSALDYMQHNRIQFSSIMEGLESSWNFLDKEHKVTYTNLAPGKYLLRVKAFSSANYGNSSEISLEITVKPPFWKTIWAYTFYFIAVVFGLFLIYRFFITREKRRNALSLERLNAKRIHEMDLMRLQFFTNVSHEFRTPLTLLSAPLESLIKENPDPAKAQSYYQLMQRNVQRLTRLIDQLLDLRKIEEGYLKMQWTLGDIIDFTRKTFDTFQNYAQKRNINFTFHTTKPEILTHFDSDKLDKILFNLLSNAFKYTGDYGNISLSLEEKNRNDLSFESQNDSYLEIKLSDSGIGIPKEAIGKLFKPFQQIESNKPIGSNATGIGLSLTKELIEMHNGLILVDSEVGKGSIFTVYLPIYKASPSSSIENIGPAMPDFKVEPDIQEAHEEIVDNVIKPLILIVEDNTDMRTFLKEELEDNYNILEAKDGQEGLEKALEKVPDLVISDIMMEKMDGVDLCSRLKNDERTSHIPVILLSARHSDDTKIGSYQTGADEYITKPFSKTVLLSRIKNLIDQRRKLQVLFGKENNPNTPNGLIGKIDSKFLERLNQTIEKYIDDPDFDPEKLASAMFMSKMQLYRKVTAVTNKTVYNYIRFIRLNKAAELLLTTDKQISEIALMVGYTEPSNFTKSFQQQFNLTPKQYIKDKRT